MTTLRFEDLKQYSDVLRSRRARRSTCASSSRATASELQNYYRSLSARSRYNRFLGAMSELPAPVLDRFTHVGMVEGFTVVATMMVDGFETIVGEARYAFHPEDASLEFGLSIEDRWQGHGIGAALMKNLECRAASLGASRLFGDTLRSNDGMIALARKAGHAFVNHPDDWKLVRFQKADQCRAKGYPLRQLAHRGAARERRGARARGFDQFPLNTGLRLSMKACTASL